MRKGPSFLYAVIAAFALAMGLLVYLTDRQPEHSYFLFHAPTLVRPAVPVFGSVGDQLPAFLHVYAFILFTVAIAGVPRARLAGICAAWFVIAVLFEIGQYPVAATAIAAFLPSWLAHFPVLDNTAAYFLRGTFDPLDILAIFLGAVAAGLTVALTSRRAVPRQPPRPRHGAWRRLALGGAMTAGMLGIVGSGGSGESSFIPGSGDPGKLYVGGNASDALLVYDAANSVTGSAASRSVTGAATALNAPRGIAVDMARNLVYVANTGGNSILVFGNARTTSGDIAPTRSISNTAAPISPTGLFLDPIGDRLYVTSGNSVLVYDDVSGLNGTGISPDRTLTGGSTALSAPTGIFVDTTRDLLYVVNGDNRILVFEDASTVTGGSTAPIRTITISAGSAGIFVDVMADRLYVSSGNSILVFDGASTADSASTPDRTLSGGASRLNRPRDIFVDTGTDRLYVANAAADTVLVFNGAGTANGSPVPDRVLNLPAFTDPWGIYVDVTPIVIGSTAGLDGEVNSDGVAVSAGGAPKVGDVEDILTSTAYRQFFSFNLANIPSGTVISTATLRLYQASVTNSPYDGALGSVVVDHVSYGEVLDATAYATATLASAGTLSSDASTGYKSLNVASRVQDDLNNGRPRSQYRLRFSLGDANLDFGDDYAQFTDFEDSCCGVNSPPQLTITIQP